MKQHECGKGLLSSGLESLVEFVIEEAGEVLLDVLLYVLDAIF